MPTYFTKSEARIAAKAPLSRVAKSSRQILAEDAARVSDSQSFDIFLSHSFLDAELVLGVKTLLQDFGHSVYVDWDNDGSVDRAAVSKKTAELLRFRMRQSKSLLYIATANASSSKWMPWELGYFDGFRPSAVAVLPLLENQSDSFAGQEYLVCIPSSQRIG
jgi:hypothetical protein